MKPIKRHESLKPLSRDHHHGLLLCWKIREGLKKEVEMERIKKYCDFFFETQLIPHFNFEEQQVFPLLGNEHTMVKQAISEHRRLESLFSEKEKVQESLEAIQQQLNNHIRFEERILFSEIQQQTDEETLNKIEKAENNIATPDPDDWDDKFWKR